MSSNTKRVTAFAFYHPSHNIHRAPVPATHYQIWQVTGRGTEWKRGPINEFCMIGIANTEWIINKMPLSPQGEPLTGGN